MMINQRTRTPPDGQPEPDALASPPSPTTSGREGTAWPLGLRVAVLALVAVALALPLVIFREQIATFADRETILGLVERVGAWGPVSLIGLVVLQTIVAPIPGQILGFAAGYLYGFGLGLLYGWLGTVLGTALAMGLARFVGRPLVVRLINPQVLDRLDRLAAGRGLFFFFLVFLIPGLPDDLLCFMAGLTPLPLPALIVLAAVARVPGVAGATAVGASAEWLGWRGWLLLVGLTIIVAVIAWRWGDRLQQKLLDLANGL